MMGEERNPGAVYRALAPPVLGYLRAERVPDPEDVLGEVFLQVTRDLRRFSGDDDALRRWVFTIARHRVIDDARRRARRPEQVVTEPPEPDAGATDPEASLDPELLAALATLTADQREVVVLRFVADLSLESVAELTGRRVGAVKALQHRALRNLADAVSQWA
jgi:RNA polymerase sigma factor (sigma-70 family)